MTDPASFVDVAARSANPYDPAVAADPVPVLPRAAGPRHRSPS